MQINANFRERVVVHSARMPWVPSPSPGVERRMLDRVGDEVARATSIVRYAPGCDFPPHTHHGGEEYLVLDGVFSDEQGDHGPGTYVRNPPTSRHAPRSRDGCTLFVKLWQFDPADRTAIRMPTAAARATGIPGRPGVAAIALFDDAQEHVRLERWAPGTQVHLPAAGGIEILVLDGAIAEGDAVLVPGSWLRLPAEAPLRALADAQGAHLWIKTGHLADGRIPARPVVGP